MSISNNHAGALKPPAERLHKSFGEWMRRTGRVLRIFPSSDLQFDPYLPKTTNLFIKTHISHAKPSPLKVEGRL